MHETEHPIDCDSAGVIEREKHFASDRRRSLAQPDRLLYETAVCQTLPTAMVYPIL